MVVMVTVMVRHLRSCRRSHRGWRRTRLRRSGIARLRSPRGTGTRSPAEELGGFVSAKLLKEKRLGNVWLLF